VLQLAGCARAGPGAGAVEGGDEAAGVAGRRLRRSGGGPAGGALAVDREALAEAVTATWSTTRYRVAPRRGDAPAGGPTIIASGPLTSDALAAEIVALTGQDGLAFFDAVAPIVEAGSINMDVAFHASRYDRRRAGRGGLPQLPMTEDEYHAFVDALLAAEQSRCATLRAGTGVSLRPCLPVEVLGRRGSEALAFGPLRPVGLVNPHTGRRPYAVVQLRQDNLRPRCTTWSASRPTCAGASKSASSPWIPGLENAEFLRYGQMHRNTFINSPALLDATLAPPPSNFTLQPSTSNSNP